MKRGEVNWNPASHLLSSFVSVTSVRHMKRNTILFTTTVCQDRSNKHHVELTTGQTVLSNPPDLHSDDGLDTQS